MKQSPTGGNARIWRANGPVSGLAVATFMFCLLLRQADAENKKFRLDLIAQVAVLEFWSGKTNWTLSVEDDWNILKSGWRLDDRGQGVWIGSRIGVLDIPIVQPQDLDFILSVYAPALENFPAQEVKVLWNGHLLSKKVLSNGPAELRFRVEKAWQRTGANRVEILPFLWKQDQNRRLGGTRASRSIRIDEVALDMAAPELVPGARPSASPDAVLSQPLGTILTYYMLYPEDGVFHAEGRVEGLFQGATDTAHGVVRVSLLDGSGTERILFERPLSEFAANPGISIEAEFYSGQSGPVALNLAVSATSTKLREARASSRIRPRPEREHEFGVQLPEFMRTNGIFPPREEIVSFWVAAETVRQVTVLLNGEEIPTTTQPRPDVIGKFPNLLSVGYRIALTRELMSPENTLEILVDGEWYLESSFASPERSLHEARVDWSRLEVEGKAQSRWALVPEDVRGRYNVVLIMCDALRADYMQSFAPTDVMTPALSAWFQESGALFEAASANSSWTRPSVASILTATRPSVHGILRKEHSFVPNIPYLPEILQADGYMTMAILSNPNIAPALGFGRGFDVVHEHFLEREVIHRENSTPEEKAEYFWSKFIEPFLDGAGNEPYFIFFHEMDPHDPYDPHPPFDTMYGPGSEFINVRSETENLIGRLAPITRSDAKFLESLYKGEITFTDRYLKELLTRLRARDSERRTLIIFTSDHGEEFWDHEQITHGKSLYEEVLHVPLVFSLDGILPAGIRLGEHVESIDIMPTILDLLGMEQSDMSQGRSLLPLMFDPSAKPRGRPRFAAFDGGRSVQVGDWKLIRESRHSLSKAELYNLKNDPKELFDLFSQKPVIGRWLMQQLRIQELVEAPLRIDSMEMEGELSPETIQDLKSLGYL